jgi:hypothetical protein
MRYNANMGMTQQTVIRDLEDPFSERNFPLRRRANDSMEESEHRRHKICHDYHLGEEQRMLPFTEKRIEKIITLREGQLERIDYVIDIFDILLRHLNENEHFTRRQRHGLTLTIENDFRLYISVARQEIYFQRRFLVIALETAKYVKTLRSALTSFQAMGKLSMTVIYMSCD